MAFKLHVHGAPEGLTVPVLGRIAVGASGVAERADTVLLNPSPDLPLDGYAAAIFGAGVASNPSAPAVPRVHALKYWDHLADGDVVILQPSGYVRTLYKQQSPHNFIFATDRCNSFCLMCSQPPKDVDDSARIHEHLRLIDLMKPAPAALGITGGEPTLLGHDFVRLIAACKDRMPETSIHVLTNGRRFAEREFCRGLAAVAHPNLVLGIPLYSDLSYEHDYVVQAAGAFNETSRGLLLLAEHGIRIEIRVVLHRLTYRRLPNLAEFIYRNLTFVDHVALMGLEPIGFAVPNLDSLWIDPYDYRTELAEATIYLASRGIHVSIYNHQLCVVSPALWPYCRRSISDWKNEYLPACDGCFARDSCGGFFSSGVARRVSAHIAPVARESPSGGPCL